jgi:response regulator RpfG family c-di-GMP phosphodiesterase
MSECLAGAGHAAAHVQPRPCGAGGAPSGAPPLRVLAVDDEPNILSALRRTLRGRGYDVQVAEGGTEALAKLAHESFDAIISDMRMPGMNGAEFLRRSREVQPEALRILLTGYADIASTIEAVNQGEIFRYISKPWNDEVLLRTLGDGLERKLLQRERERLLELVREQNQRLEAHAGELEHRVAERTRELSEAHGRLAAMNERIRDDFAATVRVLASLVDQRAGLSKGCAAAAATTARLLGEAAGLRGEALQDVVYAALLEDIGKLGLPDRLLDTPLHSLPPDDRREFLRHPQMAQGHLLAMSALQGAARVLRHRFERWDGRGEPDGLADAAVPLGARVLIVASDFERLRRGAIEARLFTHEEALRWLGYGRGKRYDPALVDAMHHLRDAAPGTRRLRTPGLEPGQVLAADLMVGSVLLLAQGRVLDERLIASLKLFERRQEVPLEIEVSHE